MKDNINDLIKVTMDFGLDHSDYIVDYKLHNAAADDKGFLKILVYSNSNSYPNMYDQCSKILEICNLQIHSSMLR